MVYDHNMRKRNTKKNSSSKNKNSDSWGLRIVKNVGGALPLVGLLVGGAALAGGAVAVSKMSNAEEEGLEVDQELDRTLQGITLNNTQTPAPIPSNTNRTNISTSTNTQTSRDNTVGARTGGSQNQTQTSSNRRGTTSTSSVTARLRNQAPSQFLNVNMNEFERGLANSSIRNIQQQMVDLFNRDSEGNGNVVGIAMPGERLDNSFVDGIIGPSTRAMIYLLKAGTGGFTGSGQSAIDSSMDQYFTDALFRRSRGITNYSWGIATIKTSRRKQRLR